MNIRAAQSFRVDFLAGGRANQRRAAEKDAPLVTHDDGVIGHRRYIRAARRARPMHHGDLRDALRREPRLIEENAAEMIAIRKDFILPRQKRAAAFDQVDARQAVIACNLLRP